MVVVFGGVYAGWCRCWYALASVWWSGGGYAVGSVFPSMKAPQLLRVLMREPLGYVVVRQRGSHRRLESRNGYPPISFSFHDSATLAPGLVRKVLTSDIGLSEQQALDIL